MFYPEHMSRVSIVSPRTHLNAVIDTLYDLKALHIKDYRPGELPMGTPLPDAEQLSKLFLDLQAIKTTLKPPQEKPASVKGDLKKIASFLEKLKQQITERTAALEAAEKQLNALQAEEKMMTFLAEAGVDRTDLLTGFTSLSRITGTVRELPPLREALARYDHVLYAHKKGADGSYPVVLFVRAEQEEDVCAVLSDIGFTPVTLPVEGSRAPSERQRLRQEMASQQETMARARRDLADLGQLHAASLTAIEQALLERIRKSEAPLKFAVSDYAFLITGWIPQQNEGRLTGRLAGISETIFLHIEEAGEDAPVKFDNPELTRPFEFFLNLFSLPRYKELDPTFFLFISFPFFFGAMLGDIGYGIVVLIAFGVLRLKVPRLSGFFTILMISALSSIIFGVIYGEFFGAEAIFSYPLHPYLHRLEQTTDLIIVSLIFGLAHLNIGFLFGFVNELHFHGFKHAVLAKLSWLVLEAGGILLLLDLMGIYAFDSTVSTIMTVSGVIMIAAGEGMQGIIEIPGLVSNILSYARIAAIGLASAALAIVVNDIAGGLFAQGGMFIIMGVLVLILGHTINILLGILGPFLQTLRLHYVELFPKFYHGNGERYEPFGA